MSDIKWGLTPSESLAWKAAYQEGRKARENGVSYHDCPYIKDTLAYNAWTKGWEAQNQN